MHIESKTRTLSNDYIALGMLCSVFIHLALLVIFKQDLLLFSQKVANPPIMVELSFETAKEAKVLVKANPPQIVSPPNISTPSETKPDSRFLSDNNFRVDKEQVKRGDNPKASLPSSSQDKTTSQSSSILTHLSLDQEMVRKKFSAEAGSNPSLVTSPESSVFSPDNKIVDLKFYQPYSRAFGTGARFLGTPGTTDYLPSLPDGDLTLLNTKANLFAVFVRRVATQVFSHIRASGWEFLNATDIRNITKDATVNAVMSPKGTLLSLSLEDRSGSKHFDEVLLGAVKQGAKDPNPPKDAAKSDGNIHFIFKAKSWVRFGADPRTGAPVERRWLLLATGLE